MSDNIIIIRPKDVQLSLRVLGLLRDRIHEQIPTGVVVIPEWCEVIKCPKDIEINIDNTYKNESSEVEELKRINNDLLIRLRHAESIMSIFDINADMIQKIDPETVRWYKSEYYPWCSARKVMIEFIMEE